MHRTSTILVASILHASTNQGSSHRYSRVWYTAVMLNLGHNLFYKAQTKTSTTVVSRGNFQIIFFQGKIEQVNQYALVLQRCEISS
jgi:hypothetical protein